MNGNWPLKPMTLAVHGALMAACLSAVAAYGNTQEWVINPPQIITYPDRAYLSEVLVDSNGQDILGADGRPLIILYNQKINSVSSGTDQSGKRLVLRTNIFSFAGEPALDVTDGSLAGITIDNQTVWSFEGPGPLEEPSKAAIHIGALSDGRAALTGSMDNSGNIKGGIYITGQARPVTGSVYRSSGLAQAGGRATVEGSFSVVDGGQAQALDSHGVLIGDQAYIDRMVVGQGSQLGTSGEGKSAVYIGQGGQLGGSLQYRHQIATLEGLVDGNNTDPVTGYPLAGDQDNLAQPDDPNNYVQVDLDGNGVDDTDGDGHNDLYKVVSFDLTDPDASGATPADYTVSGHSERQQSDTVLSVAGQLTSTRASAIKVEGTLTGKVHITPTGVLSGGFDPTEGIPAAPEKSALWIAKNDSASGHYSGTVFNEGAMTGGIFIDGLHEAAEQPLYYGLGTLTQPARLSGGYTVQGGGQALANGTGLYLDRYSTTDFISVRGTGSTGSASLLSSATGSAIYLDETATLGYEATAPAISVSQGAELKGFRTIVARGRVLGRVQVDNGTLVGLESTGSTGVAVDFSGAQSALHFRQTGPDALTQGSIIGSASLATDRVELLGGTLRGGTLTDIDELLVSSRAQVNLSGDFILPKKTIVQIEPDFDVSKPVLTIENGTLSAEDSQLILQPGDLDLEDYKILTNGAMTLVIVEADSANGGQIASGVQDHIVTRVTGLNRDHVAAMGNLVRVSRVTRPADAPERLQLTLSAIKPAEFVQTLVQGRLSETQALFISRASQAVAAADNPDSGKAQALFRALNGAADLQTLATEVTPPIGVTAQASLDAMDVGQMITQSQARGQLSGLGYGDGWALGELWGQLIYSTVDQAPAGAARGYFGRNRGMIGGGGLNLGEQWQAGLSLAMVQTSLRGDAGMALTVDSYLASLYSHWASPDRFVEAMVTLGRGSNKTRRTIEGASVSADYDSWLWGGRLLAGLWFNAGRWQWAPQAELNYGRISADRQAYTDQGGSGFEKTIKAGAYERLELGSGLRARSTLGEAFRPELSLMGYYDLNLQGSQYQASYLAGGEPFQVSESKTDRFRLQGAFAIQTQLWQGWSLKAAYTINWSRHYRVSGFSARARYRF